MTVGKQALELEIVLLSLILLRKADTLIMLSVLRRSLGTRTLLNKPETKGKMGSSSSVIKCRL